MTELVEVWENPLYYYIRRFELSEEESLDILQDVWLRVIQRLRQLRKPAAFPAWLFKITHSIIISRVRRTARSETVCTDENLSCIPEEKGDSQLDGLTSWEIHESLGRLNIIQRECLVLYFIEGFSLHEVSVILGIPVGTVKSRLYYAKKALRRLLEAEVH
jgi:RNA polymerase sigma-70 factor (ECF subfamily)